MALAPAPRALVARGPSAPQPIPDAGPVVVAPPLAPTADVATAAASDSRPQPPSYSSSYSSSPRQFASDITDPILEEGGEESGFDSPIEPVTPVSGGRHSHDFTALQNHDDASGLPASLPSSLSSGLPSGLARDLPAHNPPPPVVASVASKRAAPPLASQASHPPRPTTAASTKPPEPDPPPQTPQSRRSARGSTGGFRRTMSSFFRRTNSAVERDREYAIVDAPSFVATDASTSGFTSRSGPPPTTTTARHFSTNRSSNTTTRSNSPPSPGSPLEMVPTHRSAVAHGSLPSADDFKHKGRSATGQTLRGRAVNFVGRGRAPRPQRRASSFDGGDRALPLPGQARHGDAGDDKTFPPERLPWILPPEAGTGAKACRMSLSLPDDFTIDVAELQSEFEYQHKIFGRHGRHLGKGTASKVTLMVRRGCPGELYAVKEFRGKSRRESQEEYEKKIKSEFSIAKSLHHPNVVETIRLCTDHHRWSHVMEYCSEGDLFGLVQKGHLKGEDKRKDRLCLFKQLIQGVGYLHANGIAHRDIKLENLLLTKDSKLKITDFGVSEVFSGTHPGLRESGGQCGQNMGPVRLCSPGMCGSEPYIAPEVFEKRHMYDPRALDVWSSAIVMIYLIFGGAIWSRAERGNPHYDNLVRGWQQWNDKHPERGAGITDADYPVCLALDVGVNPPALRRLLLQMLNPDPARRIAIDGVLANRWMKNVECCQVESYDDQAHTIDASKKDAFLKNGTKKIFCHNHLPPKNAGSHSLGKMPGNPGY